MDRMNRIDENSYTAESSRTALRDIRGQKLFGFFFGLGFGFLTRNCGGFDKLEFELASVRLESGSWN